MKNLNLLGFSALLLLLPSCGGSRNTSSEQAQQVEQIPGDAQVIDPLNQPVSADTTDSERSGQTSDNQYSDEDLSELSDEEDDLLDSQD